MSDVGGLLGLFMGFSFVSAVEVLYHGITVNKVQFFREINFTKIS